MIKTELAKEKTNNIYTSWIDITRRGLRTNEWYQLNEFSLEDLKQLQWLIEQEISSRAQKDARAL